MNILELDNEFIENVEPDVFPPIVDRIEYGDSSIKGYLNGECIIVLNEVSDFSEMKFYNASGEEVKPDISELQNQKIEKSKQILDDFLETHPITSKAKGGIAARYNVTEKKRTLLMSEIFMAQAAQQAGTVYTPKWNATGKPCEDWTMTQITNLSFEMAAYVRPLVSHQQNLEVQVKACKTWEEINAIIIDYSSL